MAVLTRDGQGQTKYENGVSKGVLYRKTTVGSGSSATTKWIGYAWNGLTGVTESPEGAEKTDLYADNIKYASFRTAETFGGKYKSLYVWEDDDGDSHETIEKGDAGTYGVTVTIETKD